ncbi:MAG: ankyrin repeat domain-containing protein, partial [Gemmatimonadetes bacterium]|nr:ankyrin repeat domain-containing protein [Gemmatimonadota bacterium]
APQLANCIPWPTHRPDTSAIEIISTACVWHRPRKHEVALALIAAGASCDITVAARVGDIERVRALLDADPDQIDHRDTRGRSAMYRAGCVYGKFNEGEAVVDLLLERGALPDIFVASTFAMADSVEELLSKDPDLAKSVDPDGMTALHWAVRPRRGDGPDASIRLTKLLLEAGADVHATDPAEDDMMALHHVGEWGAAGPEQADLLLEYGADVNAKCGLGWTPLDYAIDRSRVDIADYLKSKGGKESGVR